MALTQLVWPERTEPVHLPALDVSATPLRHLGYLIEDPMPAAPIALAGDVVIVPQPARFALHKLVIAGRRPAAWATRAAKDRQQAEALLALLAEDRPGELRLAWEAVGEHEKWPARIMAEINKLSESVRDRVLAVLPTAP